MRRNRAPIGAYVRSFAFSAIVTLWHSESLADSVLDRIDDQANQYRTYLDQLSSEDQARRYAAIQVLAASEDPMLRTAAMEAAFASPDSVLKTQALRIWLMGRDKFVVNIQPIQDMDDAQIKLLSQGRSIVIDTIRFDKKSDTVITRWGTGQLSRDGLTLVNAVCSLELKPHVTGRPVLFGSIECHTNKGLARLQAEVSLS